MLCRPSGQIVGALVATLFCELREWLSTPQPPGEGPSHDGPIREKFAKKSANFIYFVWPQSEVGAQTALLLNAFVKYAVNLAFALHGLAHFPIVFKLI